MSLSAATTCEETVTDGDPIGGGVPYVGAPDAPPGRPRPESGITAASLVRLCLLLALLSVLPAHADLIFNASEGYSITWDGHDGDYFNQAVPDNLALAVNGSTAISSGELGPQQSLPYHVTSNINDGFYGNDHSWIGGDGDAAPWYAGVLFASPALITGVAFGRDNGGEASSLTDRSDGSYILQYTLDGTQWVSIGTLQYSPVGNDAILGGAFTSYYRHQYEVSTSAAEPILAEGFRIEVSATGLATGLAIDELEVYGSTVVVPEPSSFWLLGLAGLGLARRRGRSRLERS